MEEGNWTMDRLDEETLKEKRWTIDKYKRLAKKHREQFREQFLASSKPKKLFSKPFDGKKPNGTFNPANWNDFDPLRAWLDRHFVQCGKEQETMKKGDKLACVVCTCSEDTKMITIVVAEGAWHDSYRVSWYKSRGNTSMLAKNDKVMSMQDYVDLLNLLDVPLPPAMKI